jgi:hypothetical protein
MVLGCMKQDQYSTTRLVCRVYINYFAHTYSNLTPAQSEWEIDYCQLLFTPPLTISEQTKYSCQRNWLGEWLASQKLRHPAIDFQR